MVELKAEAVVVVGVRSQLGEAVEAGMTLIVAPVSTSVVSGPVWWGVVQVVLAPGVVEIEKDGTEDVEATWVGVVSCA